jgi:hypothetical protein
LTGELNFNTGNPKGESKTFKIKYYSGNHEEFGVERTFTQSPICLGATQKDG